MVDMKNDTTIVTWEGCDPTVSEAIEQFKDRWRPYSASSRRYPIVGLIQELIDPAVAAYTATLPQRYLGHIPGAGTGVSFSGIIRLVGLDAMVRMQRQLLRQFIKTGDKQTPRDRRFVATLESLIGLVWDCACKRPTKSKVRDTRLNGERLQGFCRFCGSLAELTLFAGGSDDPKADDPEEKLRLSSLYCLDHRPKLPSGAWNPAYRQARRSLAQFDLELARLSQQCAKPATAQMKSGDQLVDSYFFHYVTGQTLQPADKAELRNQARLMVDSKLSDRKKQMLMLQWSGLNQSEIALKLGIERQAVSKALASIPAMYHLRSKSRSRRQPN
ncbi:LuxR family transcriptional regulator [Xanthomonas hortorum]|uniref:LuxR family transcriptional regulator n=1 Tax=Xanthomonas hortorum TaxID=56454 RepID=UPI001F34B8D2|nr:LuxR family transcriptional regulator [Xanthomonas hortorum]MCE4361745.1 LuxR family transcriptional regulator [Xanthomonas hortorum]